MPQVADARPPERIDLGDIALVRWSPGHQHAVNEAVAASIEHLRPWMPWAQDANAGTNLDFLERTNEQWRAGMEFAYGVWDRGGTLVGSASLMDRVGPGSLEIGYWVRADRVREHIASRATAALVDVAFTFPAVEVVEIHHDRENEPSGGVPRSLGFERAGEFEKEPTAPGESGVFVRWLMRRDSWAARRPDG
ncbi:MAG TPA: GNAT family N-acetyltransferase [Solirubrobacteraceae bacterium]|nr:GNAT family N-acetyltransferase [Solirubrobacteraceae bacterium]